MVDKIKLYTSLPPASMRQLAGIEVGSAYVAQCVKSWRRADFDVISLNCAEEIEALSRHGVDVELKQISGNRPTLADFLRAIRDSGSPVAGIINADVFLSDDCELLQAVIDGSGDGMTMIERINIDPTNLRPTGRSCNGIDAFIFRTEPLARIDLDFEFLFGQPWWDYWLPLAYAAAGGKLMKIKDPFLFHLDHPQKWNQGQWIANGQKTVRYFLRSTGVLPDDFVAEIAKFGGSSNMSEDSLGPFSHWCFAKLREMAELIDPPRKDCSLSALVAFLDDPVSRSMVGELNDAQARIAGMKDIVDASISIWGAAVEVCNSFGDRSSAQQSDSSYLAVQSRQIYDLHQRMSSLLLKRPITNYEDMLRAVNAANHILSSRKASLTRFVALNFAWIRSKCIGLYDRKL